MQSVNSAGYQVTISRDDRYHEAWPDVVTASNGDLVVVYRESDAHRSVLFDRIYTRISIDGGRTWGDKQIVYACEDPDTEGQASMARLCRLPNGCIIMTVDIYPPRNQWPADAPYFWKENNIRTVLFRSTDNGRTWSSPQSTSVRGLGPSLTVLRNGDLLLGVTRFVYPESSKSQYQIQVVYRSTDGGVTWSPAQTVLDNPRFSVSEGDAVELDNGDLVFYLRQEDFDTDLPYSTTGLKMISHDGGLTWEGPYSAGRWMFNGRIKAGLLSSGHVMVTSRLGAGPQRPYYGEFYWTSGREREYVGLWRQDTPFFYAHIETQENALAKNPPIADYDTPTPEGTKWVLIDRDLSPAPDFGYSGWTNLPSGEVFITQYIVDEAPGGCPQVRGYIFRPDELLNSTRKEEIAFSPPSYVPGFLKGQDGWFTGTGIVSSSPWEAPSSSGETVRKCKGVSVFQAGEGVVIANPDAPQTVRRGIGPFNLFDEAVDIDIEHRGTGQKARVELLDDFGNCIVLVESTEAGLRAESPMAGGASASMGGAIGWLRTRIHLEAGKVSLSTTPAEADEPGVPWLSLDVPNLKTLFALAVTIGKGDFSIRRIGVKPVHRTQSEAASGATK